MFRTNNDMPNTKAIINAHCALTEIMPIVKMKKQLRADMKTCDPRIDTDNDFFLYILIIAKATTVIRQKNINIIKGCVFIS